MPMTKNRSVLLLLTLACMQVLGPTIGTSSTFADTTDATTSQSPPPSTTPPESTIAVVATDIFGQGIIGTEVHTRQGTNSNESDNSGSRSQADPQVSTEDNAKPDDNADEIIIAPGQCNWHVVNAPAGDPAWEGNDPSTGIVLENNCDGPVRTLFIAVPNAAVPAVPPPPSPQELAERAYREMIMPKPKISAGPDRTKLAVNLWTWLWIDNPGPQSTTVAAGGVSVTLTATLASVTWSLGEPAATGGPYAPGPPVTITCKGTGTAPATNYDWKAEPPCGHKYTWMSTKERTGGTGKWPITATSNWSVTWQSNTGVSGSTTLSATGNDALEIGEYRIVLVQGPGG